MFIDLEAWEASMLQLPFWHLLSLFAGLTRKLRLWGFGSLTGLIFIDLGLWRLGYFRYVFYTFCCFSLALLENYGSEACEACQTWFSLIWRLGRLVCFSYLFCTFCRFSLVPVENVGSYLEALPGMIFIALEAWEGFSYFFITFFDFSEALLEKQGSEAW